MTAFLSWNTIQRVLGTTFSFFFSKQRVLRTTFSFFFFIHFLSLPAQSWGDINYTGRPWVENVSLPYDITRGLQNRHITLWASHGRYYDQDRCEWRWQRPTLFTTNEDLYTQTIVVPFLIPMLENAGAVVFTPRERDWQRHEVIVDNDDHTTLTAYHESSYKKGWQNTGIQGFAQHPGHYIDGENPFLAGTARQAETTTSKSKYSLISFQPTFTEAGRYAVYVSYQTVDHSIDDAHYTVWHQGIKTEFRVNQQMGGSTWVYLGTFDFDAGCNQWNRVVLTNQSDSKGIVTADAVRFGGGMGNIERGGEISGLPRCLEASRYYCQWAGMPFEVYSSKSGQDDYKDDINARSLTENLLAGGSCYLPNREGRRVPMELSLAVHSDAGYNPDGQSIYGALSIHTTQNDNGDSVFDCGLPRTMSAELAGDLLQNVDRDIRARFGIEWPQRELRDRNYSETRLPEVPSAILETMSHQSFPDMRYGQDPNFRFTLARSIYKTILRYICRTHDRDFVVTPLAPTHLQVTFSNMKRGEVRLSWAAVDDPQEPTAQPSGFIVYTAKGQGGYDNGTHVHANSYTLRLEPGELYSFRVAAVNRGGQSFPSEVVSALYQPKASKTVLVVNGFHRLASPAFIDNETEQGFVIDEDMGVSYGRTPGFTGRQLYYYKDKMGIEDSTGLGFGFTELAGRFIAGNEFNYVRTHAETIRQAGTYNIVSCSSYALDRMDDRNIAVVDLVLGLERNDGYSLLPYKTFTPDMQSWLSNYTRRGGRLLVSGSFVGSDMATDQERAFLSQVLKCSWAGKDNDTSESVSGMGTKFKFYRQPNELHYAAQHPDILQTDGDNAMATMAYGDGYGAAVAYSGSDYRTFTMGFPFECIQSDRTRVAIMQGILNYLIK